MALLLSITLQGVEARGCKCNNGRVVVSEPRCECECLDNFQLPDCDYKINEMVRLDVYLNMPQKEFQSADFLAAVEKGTLLEPGSTLFRFANGLPEFNKTNVLIEMPGYGVRRFMPMVEERELWVQKERIESAYVIALPEPLSKASYFPTFDYNGYTITAEGWAWLGAGFICFVVLCCESCCCMTNDEDKAYETNDPDGSRELMRLRKEQERNQTFWGDSINPSPAPQGGSPAKNPMLQSVNPGGDDDM